jgi:nitroreductase
MSVQPLAAPPPVDEILELACRAPSVHNTQPWTWRVTGSRVDLFADFRRQLVYADPGRRDLLVSCGAALHHLQVASAGLGWAARVRRCPDPGEERHLASVQLRPARAHAEALARLDALTARRTDRRRLTSWPVPRERLNALAATGSVWGAQVLPVVDPSMRGHLERLTRRADRLQRRNERYLSELAAWTATSPAEGVPPALRPVRDPAETLEPGNVVDLAARRFPSGTLADPVVDPGSPADGMLLVCTSSDDTISRLRAGEALSAVWLHATGEGLSLVPLSQAMEVEETRRALQGDVLGDLACPQMLVRVGWLPLSRPDLPPTPRRPLSEVRTVV